MDEKMSLDDLRLENESLRKELLRLTQSKDELRKINLLFNHSEQIAKVGYWEWDEIADQYLTCSEQFAAIMGLTVKQMVEQVANNEEDRELICAVDRERYSQVVDSAVESKQGWDIKYSCNTRAGRQIYLHEIGEPVLDDYGVLIKTIGTIQDITEKRQEEEELRQSNALFQQAEAMGNMGHFCWDLVKDKLISCSDQYALIFGMTVPKALDCFISTDVIMNLIHPDDKEIFRQNTYVYNKLPKGNDIEYRIIISENTRYLYVRRDLAFDSNGVPSQSFGTVLDITARKKNEEKLSYQATHDALTGLINRVEFEQRTNRLLSTIEKDEAEHAMCFLDLDQFKVINDTCGHLAGDELLRQLGMLLHNTVREQDTLARLGGDEFGVLMEHCPVDQAQRVAEAILDAINGFQFFWEGETFRIGVSIGLISITKATGNYTDLFKQADAACYLAKEFGRNRIHIYHPDDTEMVRRKSEMQWVGQINQALVDERFRLYAQPIKGISGNDEMHYEVLLRLLNENDEIVLPGAFLPAAERYNLIEKMDRWVVKNTFELMAANTKFFDDIHFISINLSGKSMTNPKFLEYILSELNRTKIKSKQICFEVTETVAISNLDAASTFISILKEVGFSFALDDFGSGLSSFGYLKTLPVDYLKIDGMFVKDMINDPIDKSMVESINNIGHVMGMKTIAEFVETDEIKIMLDDIGVDYVQGYGIGKPELFDEVIKQFNNV